MTTFFGNLRAAENYLIVGSSWTRKYLTGGVCGVRYCIGTGVRECQSSRRGARYIWAIGIIATVTKRTCESVRCLAKIGNVGDRAARAWARIDSLWVDRYTQIVRIHVTDLIRICVAGTVDGELSEVCLKLGRAAIWIICTVSWKAPNLNTVRVGAVGETSAGRCKIGSRYASGIVIAYCNGVWTLIRAVEYHNTCRAQYYSCDDQNIRRKPRIGELREE
jgi:hypothetical protein